jgi:Quinolinate synthetase A protein/HD domain
VLLTECSMSDNVALQYPELEFVRPCNLCPHMKRITLPQIRQGIETMTHEVIVDLAVAERARHTIERMTALGEKAQDAALAPASPDMLWRDCEEHMLVSEVTGDLPKIIGNEEHLYEGDLTFYFRTLFFKSRNLHNPYHNFRHMLHVLWLCHKACRYYQSELIPRQMRNLLITALFHDFDHPGHPHPGEDDPDRINIQIAISGLRRYIMPIDRVFLPEIEALIEATQYPYKIGSEKLDLLGRIIRDADLAQALSPAWIQQVVIGLAQEWGVQPLEVLKGQASFLAGLSFHTPWARQLFPDEIIQAKTEEVEQLLRLLQTEPATTGGD